MARKAVAPKYAIDNPSSCVTIPLTNLCTICTILVSGGHFYEHPQTTGVGPALGAADSRRLRRTPGRPLRTLAFLGGLASAVIRRRLALKFDGRWHLC